MRLFFRVFRIFVFCAPVTCDDYVLSRFNDLNLGVHAFLTASGQLCYFVIITTWTSAFMRSWRPLAYRLEPRRSCVFVGLWPFLLVIMTTWTSAFMRFCWPLAFFACHYDDLNLGVHAFLSASCLFCLSLWRLEPRRSCVDFRTSRRAWHPRRSFRLERLRTYPDIFVILDFGIYSFVFMLYFPTILVQDRHVDMSIRSRL